MIVVKINYRIGLFGYFAHPELAESNVGTLDQIVALEWIQRNIAAFGGDRNCVTIFGVSAGGDAVAHMLVNERAAGLCHRAILQSANVTHQFVHRKHAVLGYISAEDAGATFATKLVGDAPGQLERLRAMPASEIYQHYSDEKATNANWQGFWPCVDGDVIPMQIFAAFEQGRHNKVPILVGSNLNEGQSIDQCETHA